MLVQWLLAALVILAILAGSVLVAFAIAARRQGARAPKESGWLTDDMIQEILHSGKLSDRHVPEAGLDLDEIAREEERFWSETWDEPESNWD